MDKKIYFPKKTINNYMETLQTDIEISGVLLFGSFAYGKPTKHSDVDLVIISPNFRKKNWGDRITWLNNKRWGVATSIAMDIIGYTPEEFAHIEDESAIMAYAKKHGKWLYKNRALL